MKTDTIQARHVAVGNIIQGLLISLTGVVIHHVLALLQCPTASQGCTPFTRPGGYPESKVSPC